MATGVRHSASPEVLGDMIERLMACVREMQSELAVLRAECFGAKREKIPAGKKDGVKSEKAVVTGDEQSQETKEQIRERRDEIKRLRAEARRLAAADQVKVTKKRVIGPQVQRETVRRRLPDDIDIVCPFCAGVLVDKGVAHRVREVDVVPSAYIEREYLLHKAECPCGSLRLHMPGPQRGLDKTDYSPAFIARVIYDKFVNHLPLARQARHMAMQGLKVHRDVLIGLVLRGWTLFSPLVDPPNKDTFWDAA